MIESLKYSLENYQFGIAIFRDGNQYCALIGENLQDGYCGFGPRVKDALDALTVDVWKAIDDGRLPMADALRMLGLATADELNALQRDRALPRAGEIWQHFKHRDGADIFCGEYHRYHIWDVTEAEPQHPQAELQPFSVQHVETGQFHNVFEYNGKWWVEGLSEPHVLYTVNFETHTVWCRALDEFMAPDDRSPNGFKFWKIAGNREEYLIYVGDKPAPTYGIFWQPPQ